MNIGFWLSSILPQLALHIWLLAMQHWQYLLVSSLLQVQVGLWSLEELFSDTPSTDTKKPLIRKPAGFGPLCPPKGTGELSEACRDCAHLPVLSQILGCKLHGLNRVLLYNLLWISFSSASRRRFILATIICDTCNLGLELMLLIKIQCIFHSKILHLHRGHSINTEF